MKDKYEELLLCFLSISTIIFWWAQPQIGMIVFFVVAAILFFFKKEIKYLLSIIIFYLFLSKDTFVMQRPPLVFIVVSILFLILLIIAALQRKPSVRNGQSKTGFLLLAVSAIIPILWSPPLSDQWVKLIYFNWGLYALLYLLVVNSVHQSMLPFIVKTLSYLPIVFFGQLLIKTVTTPNWQNKINMLGQNLGWGIGNEVAILLCLSLPFCFYRLWKERSKWIPCVLILYSVLTCIFTFSRGGYLCYGFTFGVCYLVTFFKIVPKQKRILFLGCSMLVGMLLLLLMIRLRIIHAVFQSGFQDSGRFQLYQEAWKVYFSNLRNFLFGAGNITRIDYNNRMIVYHSTIFETMAKMGSFGLFALGIHLWQKYRSITWEYTLDKVILFAYLMTDFYGLFDNSYHMYYYMIPLIILIGVFEKEKMFEIEKYQKRES